eukprot:2068092-Karenia_brevis.AAC.1
MNQSSSEEKEKAQMTTSSEAHVHQSKTTAFMPECGILNLTDSNHAEGASRDDQTKEAHAYQNDSGSRTSESSMTN